VAAAHYPIPSFFSTASLHPSLSTSLCFFFFPKVNHTRPLPVDGFPHISTCEEERTRWKIALLLFSLSRQRSHRRSHHPTTVIIMPRSFRHMAESSLVVIVVSTCVCVRQHYFTVMFSTGQPSSPPERVCICVCV
jgi:hypothetical protein